MKQLFDEAHYRTAEQFSFGHFADDYGQTTAELWLTLSKLTAGQPFTIDRDDLIGYHALHYGANPSIVDETLDIAVSSRPAVNEPFRKLQELDLESLLSPNTLSQPLALGRISITAGTKVAGSLLGYTEHREVTPGDGLYAGSMRFGEFLYPLNGARLEFLGGTTCRIATEDSGRYKERIGGQDYYVNQLEVRSDIIHASTEDGQTAQFIATTLHQNHRRKLQEIRALRT